MPVAFRTRAWTALALLACLACGCAPRGHRAAAPALHRVVIRQIAFQPAAVTAAPGDTIEWWNADLVPHTTSATDSTWDSGDLSPDHAWRWIVRGTGTIPYSCRYHTTMHGTVTVTE
jgi:plastocyanin